MAELIWTREMVKDWFESAVYTLKKMPREKVQGYKTYWPGIRYTEMELLHMDSKPIRLVANSLDIARLDAVLEWIYLVDNVDQRWIIWQRAKRYPWRLICKRYGKTSRTLIDWHNAGIDVIVKVLNNPKSDLFARNRVLLSKYLSY